MTQPPPDEHPVVVVDGDDRRSDRGDTLVELLLAMVLMAIVSVSLLSAFGTSFTDSAEVKVLNTLNTTLDQYAQIATTQIQLQANTAFGPCATVKTYSVTAPAPPAGYTVGIAAISYFNGSTFTDACPSGIVHTQLITITATGPACATYPTPGPKCLSKSLSFPVSNYGLTGVTAPSLPAATSAIVASPNSQLLNFQALAWPVPNFTLANCTNQLGASCTSMFTFTDNGDGVASLVPNANLDLGTYTLTIAASNGAGTATQTVTYVLNEATTIAVAASPSSSSYSSPVLLTAQVYGHHPARRYGAGERDLHRGRGWTLPRAEFVGHNFGDRNACTDGYWAHGDFGRSISRQRLGDLPDPGQRGDHGQPRA